MWIHLIILGINIIISTLDPICQNNKFCLLKFIDLLTVCDFLSRPPSGSMLLFSRQKVRYRKDGYYWKKRKDGKTTREDHMKLKVQGVECIYGCYVHSAILPTFHRRCYWLLQVSTVQEGSI